MARQISLLNLLIVIFGTELVCAIYVLVRPDSTEPVQLIGYALVTSLIVGIARAWELVGDRDTGLSASIAVLTGHARSFAPRRARTSGRRIRASRASRTRASRG